MTGLAPSTTHTYTVVAFDAAGNVSAAQQRGHRDRRRPRPTRSRRRRPRNFRVTGVTTTTIALAWNASTDNIGVAGYRIREGTTIVGTTTALTFTVTGLTPGTTHTYTAVAFDAAGNVSPASNAATGTTSSTPDTQPPTAPTNLAVGAKTSTTVTLTWTASTDNVGVTGYRVMEGTTQVGTGTATTFTVTGLLPSSTHTYTVTAFDAAGNVSPPSNAVTVTTDPATVSTLKVQYRAADTSATDQQIKPHLNIVNTGTTAVPLSELTARYWYTREGTQTQAYDCDYAQVGCANVTASFVTLASPVPGANMYLQLAFGAGAGTLNGGAQTGEMQNRLHNQNWSSYNEADDYSYDPTKTAFADWNRVTLYRSGTLVWGVEPVPAGPDFSLAASPASVSASQGGTAASTIAITRLMGFTGAVAFTASGLPAGATATFNPASTTGNSSTVTFAAAASTPVGTSQVTVTGTSGALVRTVNVSLAVTASQTPDFSLSASPASVSVQQGASAVSTLTITRVNGFTGSVLFGAAGLPAGVSATFTPPSTTGNTATVTFAATATAATGTAPVTVSGTSGTLVHTVSIGVTVTQPVPNNAYLQRFRDLWDELHGTTANNGYFHPANVPYHSVETLICEAPDHGHETTSEAFSYWVWLEAMHGHLTGDWAPLQQAFTSIESHIIPTQADQPTNSFYNASDPADYAPEADLPSGYPSVINSSTPVGTDPIAAELRTAYNTPNVYGMHWILDVDNFYGYGRRGDGTSQPSYINTFQRGPQESVWETVPQPSWEDFQWGAGTAGGYLPLFITGPSPARQWRYTNAPDADARLVQAMYWAKTFADARGGSAAVDSLAAKAAQMGDYLRYAMFDKYFKTDGLHQPDLPRGHRLQRGPLPDVLVLRVGRRHRRLRRLGLAHRLEPQPLRLPEPDGRARAHDHAGACAALAQRRARLDDQPRAPARVLPLAAVGRRRHRRRRHQQLGRPLRHAARGRADVLRRCSTRRTRSTSIPAATPGSASRPGRWSAWPSTTTSPATIARSLILDKWVTWAMANTRLLTNGSYEIPSTLDWDGQPSLNWNATTQNWNAADATYNAGLRAIVVDFTQDVGVAAALAKTLTYYSAGRTRWGAPHPSSQVLAKELLDRMWTLYRDETGVAVPETRRDYNRFDDPVFVPAGFTGAMPNGDPITASSTFIGLRSDLRSDPAWPQVQAYLDGGPAPTFTYHRFWAQVDIALANAEYGRLFP